MACFDARDIPMPRSFRRSYDDLCIMREQVERRYQEDFDGKLYTTLRNERRDGYFHPSQLPRKLAPIADVLDPTSDIKAPTLRMLNRVPQHQRWLACLQACHDADTATPTPSPSSRGGPLHLRLPAHLGWRTRHRTRRHVLHHG